MAPTVKRKQKNLTIAEKVELLRKLQRGTSVKRLGQEYGVGSSTVYDLKKNREKLLKAFAESDAPKAMMCRKTLHKAKNDDVDKVLYEWFRQRRSEGVPISGPMLTVQAQIFHKELKVATSCSYSQGWLHRFKLRHGIRQLAVCGEKISADSEAADTYIDDFANLVKDMSLTSEQIYNADETGLYYRCLPRHTLAAEDEVSATGVKEAKERLTILNCSNAAGTHKSKLLVIGKSLNPRCFKGIKCFPVLYRANKKAWMTSDIMLDWFENYFIPDARRHCESVGLAKDCKIMLILDNCTAHPEVELKERAENHNVITEFLPPNCTSLIQPMDQGIISAMKRIYRSEFLKNLISHCDDASDSIGAYIKQFTVKDAIWAIARSWNDVKCETLKKCWYNLWPAGIFDENENDDQDFEGFCASEKKKLLGELLHYAKNTISGVVTESDIAQWITVDEDAPTVAKLSDKEIANIVLHTDPESEDSEEEIGDDKEKKKVTTEECIKLTKDLIAGLEQKSFISEQEIMNLYLLQEKLINEKSKCLKQNSILKYVQNIE